MDWDQLLAQAGLVFLKEGLNFVFSRFKDKKEAEDEKEKLEEEALVSVWEAVEDELVQKADAAESAISWSKVGTLFWLGNDLMWVQDMMYRAARPERVLQGVQHAQRYAEDLGFDDKSFPSQQLAITISILESLRGITEFSEEERRLLQQHYGTVDQYINTVKWYVHAVLQQQQPDFKKLRTI